MMLAGVASACAQGPVFEAFDDRGRLVCGNLQPGSTCIVEWTAEINASLGAPWQHFTTLVAHGTAVTSDVPMNHEARGFFRAWGAVWTPPPRHVPEGMVLIPAGFFDMGNGMSPDEGDPKELPVHSVWISAFLMDRHEVSKALWDQVCDWAVANGYAFETTGLGKAANHPVHTVNWYDCVKWCNARSAREGLTPCYTVNGIVYRTGRALPDCNWEADGYRLPTEAEWERAARGGANGRRFPWTDIDTIDHSRANYYGTNMIGTNPLVYDMALGYHPVYDDGVKPFTAPVEAFATNGFGLHNMAGNVREWCWDRYASDYYEISPSRDPRGPDSGNTRVARGGSWYNNASMSRCSKRVDFSPWGSWDDLGFRCVRR